MSFTNTNYAVVFGLIESSSSQGIRVRTRNKTSFEVGRVGSANAGGWYLCIGY